MTITPELKRAVEQSGGTPIHIEDPETRQGYVLLSAEQYEALRSPPDPVDEMAPFLDESFREGWDDPALDVYNDLDPRGPLTIAPVGL